jgi:hypothetical protein
MPNLTLPNGQAFDAGLAAFAAVSAGFVAFAMPDALFTGLVETSRLPDFVAAARPPLGETARFAAVAAAASFTFAAIWALMASLGRAPARLEAAAESEAQAPRQRRADAHPDAPPRPPLLARDLGEPLELHDVAPEPAETVQFVGTELRPLPGFLIPQEPEPEPLAEADEPLAEPQPAPKPVAEWEAEPAPVSEDMPIADLVARLPEAEEDSDQSLSQLVNRIESGLSRKRQALPAVELPAAGESPIEEERVGHRLRSAINDLQKIASSGA